MALAERCRNSFAGCKRMKNFPKYSCRTCRFAYTDNFEKDRQLDPMYRRRQEKKTMLNESDQRLRQLYGRIRTKYFPEAYLPVPEIVTFVWKRGRTWGGCCWKHFKKIKIGGVYKYAFSNKGPENSIESNFNDARREGLVSLLIHEMCHLRLAHHRKNFKAKVADIEAKVSKEHTPELFAGLIG